MEVIFGPPGTGKTTELSRLVAAHTETDGADTVLLSAYTRTAAREMAGRDLPIDTKQVGTLHAHCLRALGRPALAESKLKDWNTAYPNYRLRRGGIDRQSEPGSARDDGGDALVAAVDLLRNRCVPEMRWPAAAQYFWKRWQDWKHQCGVKDFTDLIDDARALSPVAPGNPRTLVIDEAQDLTLLQWRLIHQWGQHARRVICAGDDDQALYRWAGADFHPMLAADMRRVLPQSYRVPAAVQRHAMKYLTHIHDRQAKRWEPRDTEGICASLASTWDHPDEILAQVQSLLDVPFGGTIALLAPCGYMLSPILAALKDCGIPFSNRWRAATRAWNPLAPPERGISAAQRLADFLRPSDRLWTWGECASWLPWLSTAWTQPGAKALLAARADDPRIMTIDDLGAVLTPAGQAGALHGLDWLHDAITQAAMEALCYPVRVFQRYGREALFAEPRLSVGTIHSVKGAQADTVFLVTALSKQQRLALLARGHEAEDVWRMLYVGCTRAREALYCCGPMYV